MSFTAIVAAAVLSLAAPPEGPNPAQELRERIDGTMLAKAGRRVEVHRTQDLTVEHGGLRVPVRVYWPSAAEALPVAVMVHGGAFVAGSVETHDPMARALTAASGVVIVSVNYTVAPLARHPRQIEECEAVIAWLRERGKEELKVSTDRIGLVGDSAGGYFCAAVSLRARDRGQPVDFQALINPITDATSGLVPTERLKSFTKTCMTFYAAEGQPLTDSGLSPLAAASHKGLPPTLVIVSEKDGWGPEGVAFAEKLRAAGVRTNLYTLFGQGHLGPDGARATEETREGLEIAGAALGGALRASRP